MAFKLPELPYSKDALSPHISARTLEFHYGKHHQGYVNKLNAAVEGDSALAGKSLEDIIRTAKGGVFNNAAQVWNHTFYWHSMSPNGGGAPSGDIAKAIDKAFGSFSDFKEKFSTAAAGQFGSGWAWLVKDAAGQLAITTTSNAGTPLTEGQKAILTCDVWEHAYYLDYQNARPSYIEAWWNLVNWEHAAKNL
ncbi:MAG: superoxide dismutase [Myxococcales bacterium]|nr:superoxide dismutase [Myxococcales bacterium]MCB9540701.1 superoxide dismutase [Myxococcales bacterium]